MFFEDKRWSFDTYSIFKKRRLSFVPKRTSELVALIAISSTLFLFLHTRDLHEQLKQMEVKLDPASSSSAGSSSGSNSDMLNREDTSISLINEIQEEHLDPLSLNNTARSRHEVLFFNRVPKVGSQTFMELMRHLSVRNGFGFHRDHIQRVETIRLPRPEQKQLAEMISSYSTPSVYIKHICFINFTEFHMPEPIYVNLVRDPVERVISWYYYVRAPWYYVERKQAFPDLPLPDPAWLKKDFESCVLRGDRECSYLSGETREGIGDHRRQSLFFCGHDESCLPFNTVGALEKAKMAVEKHYAVVGVLEDLNTTMTVMENYIPRFFAHASQIYHEDMVQYRKINHNIFKPPVREEIKQIVRQNFTREIEFYQFCRQRLHRQLYALNNLK
uniref:Heparan sulfate 2-O-sulfotransferase pipe n=1 Tax=Cacopsylla melanoneura TaxID=428564 RepID=A0A8D9B2P0_9HEMI